jgi:exocyst complex component 4
LSENHIIVGELLEQKSTEVDNVNTPHIANGDASWNPDSESSQATGGFSVAFSLSVVQVSFYTTCLSFLL